MDEAFYQLIADINKRIDNIPTAGIDQIKPLVAGIMTAFEAKADQKIAEMQKIVDAMKACNQEMASSMHPPERLTKDGEPVEEALLKQLSSLTGQLGAQSVGLDRVLTLLAKPVLKEGVAETPTGQIKLKVREVRQ